MRNYTSIKNTTNNVKVNHSNPAGCTRCNLTDHYQFAEFNSQHECKYCQSFEEKIFKGLDQLVKDVNLSENEKIGITVSGGKDSIYMWGVLTELFGKDRVVAFSFYRPTITHQMALENVKKAQAVLGTELVVHNDSKAFDRFKKNFGILLENPDPAMVRVLLCVGCRYGITENLYKIGEKMGVTKFISGASYLELAPFKEELLQDKSPSGNIDDGLARGIEQYRGLDWEDNLSLILRDQKYKYKNNNTQGNNIASKGYKYTLFDFDNYVENNPEYIQAVVKEKYGWDCPERSWHFDCIIEEFKDIFYYGLLGYTETDFKTSAMVRHNLLTKAQAHHRMLQNNLNLRYSFKKMTEMLSAYGMEEYTEQLAEFYRSSPFLENPDDGILGNDVTHLIKTC